MTHAAFRLLLAQTTAAVEHYIVRVPNWHLAAQVAPQLAALEQWTRAGRRPSKHKRSRVNLGLLAVREIEPTDDLELYRIAQAFHELNYALDKMPLQPLSDWLNQIFRRAP